MIKFKKTQFRANKATNFELFVLVRQIPLWKPNLNFSLEPHSCFTKRYWRKFNVLSFWSFFLAKSFKLRLRVDARATKSKDNFNGSDQDMLSIECFMEPTNVHGLSPEAVVCRSPPFSHWSVPNWRYPDPQCKGQNYFSQEVWSE